MRKMVKSVSFPDEDKDVYEFALQQGNFSRYVVDLIRKDMNKDSNKTDTSNLDLHKIRDIIKEEIQKTLGNSSENQQSNQQFSDDVFQSVQGLFDNI